VNRIDATVDIDEDRPEVRLHHDQSHALVKQFLCDAASCFEEIGRLIFPR